MSTTFKDHHLSGLDLLLNAKKRQVRESLPTYADGFDKRTNDELRRAASLFLDQLDVVRTSSRYSDNRKEQRLLAHGFLEQRLTPLRKDTVEKLEAQRQARQAAVVAPKKAEKDAALALVHELRLQEVRRDLRSLDALALQVRLRLAASTEAGELLLDAIESDPVAKAGGTPIVGADVLRETREAMAMAADPQLGELALLRDAYTFVLGGVEQMVLEATGLSQQEIRTDPAPPEHEGRRPVLLSTGQPV